MSTNTVQSDLGNDFDHLDPNWVADPYPIWDEMRQSCPVAHTDKFNGVYFPSRYEDVRAIAYDTEHFSSRRVVVRSEPPEPLPINPPITSDPPAHRAHRKLLLPAFTPDAVSCHEPHARAVCQELITRLTGKEQCDGAADYAQHIPVRIIAHMLGVPAQDADCFAVGSGTCWTSALPSRTAWRRPPKRCTITLRKSWLSGAKCRLTI